MTLKSNYFLRSTTPLKGDHIDTILQMLDRQGHGGITWENFYLGVAILISLKAGFPPHKNYKVHFLIENSSVLGKYVQLYKALIIRVRVLKS